jgi:hypothetical protein
MTIEPCTDNFDSRFGHERCNECTHVLAVHGEDKVCDICDAMEGLAGRSVPKTS